VRHVKHRVRAQIPHRADGAAVVEHAHWLPIGQRDAEHLAFRQIAHASDVLVVAHDPVASSRKADCSVCRGMLAHLTRTGKRETPLNAAISPIARASPASGLSFPVTSSWNCVNNLSTSARDFPFTACVMIDADARDTAQPDAVNFTSSMASFTTLS